MFATTDFFCFFLHDILSLKLLGKLKIKEAHPYTVA